MITHNLVQGTPEWNDYRSKHFNASDAPAMLGLSKYKTRLQLLDERKTGLVKEVDAFTQKLFDDGHKFEALARPVAEQIIGEELSPVTGSNGNLSASFDGLTFMGDIAFEHKSLNDEIRACNTVEQLAMMYRVQMQQQLMVSGAEKCLFLATSWDKNNEMIECKNFWFEGDKYIEAMIVEGWAQFQSDLDTHIPVVAVAAPTEQPIVALPALFIHAKGEITTSNMKEYGEALAKRLVEVRSIALVSDQDFADAKSAAKHLRDGIVQANLAKEAMLSQTVTVGEAARMIDTWCEDMRLTALKLEKDVKDKDLVKKQAMIQAAQDSFTKLIAVLEKDTAPIRLNITMPNFAEAIKGKSKYDSMQDAISTLVANSTIAANQVAIDIRDKQRLMAEFNGGYSFLFADLQQIIFKPLDDFKLLISSRIDAHIKLTAEREAKIKADAEAAALAKAADAELARKAAEASKVAQENIKAKNEVAAIAVKEAATTGMEAVITSIDHGNFDMTQVVVKDLFTKCPSALDIVQNIADRYNVTLEQSLKWLQTWDFNKVNLTKAA